MVAAFVDGNTVRGDCPCPPDQSRSFESGDQSMDRALREPSRGDELRCGEFSLEWDTSDRLVSETDPAGGVTRYSYDTVDHLTSRTDPDGAVTRYGWDRLFRLVTVTAPDGGTTRYEYNREDDLTATTDPLGNQTQFVLDELYRPVTTIDPNGGHWQRTYDEVGNITEQTDPEGATGGRQSTRELDLYDNASQCVVGRILEGLAIRRVL